MRRLDAVVNNAWKLRTGRTRINHRHHCSSDIRFVVFMGHMNLETLVKVEKVAIDVLQSLVVLFQGFEEHRLALKHFLGRDGVCHLLQNDTPCCHIRSGVWRSQENDSKGGDEDRSGILLVLVSQVIGINEGSLDKNAAQAVCDEDDGILICALTFTIEGEVCDQCLSMLVDEVVACTCAFTGGIDVCVVAIDQDIGASLS